MAGQRSLHHISNVPLVKAGEATTTELSNDAPKKISIDTKAVRREQNEKYLENSNVKAFLGMITWAEGGGYDFKYGAVSGRKNDKWRFSDYSTHPGCGIDGHTTAAGAYQITVDTWKDHGVKAMGLSDFSHKTQDLIAVDKLRRLKVIDSLVEGDIAAVMKGASYPWAALPMGPGQGNRYPKQPYKAYEDCLEKFEQLGGVVK